MGYDRKARDRAIKAEAMEAYGGRCVSCGESRLAHLALDHIEDNGAQHRRETGTKGGVPFYRAMKRQGWPPGLQVLCHGCNMVKQITGRLPGKKKIVHFTKRGPNGFNDRPDETVLPRLRATSRPSRPTPAFAHRKELGSHNQGGR